MTDNLLSEMSLAFAAMSKSSALNGLYAKKFNRENRRLLSSLLRAIARADNIQARRSLMYIRGKIGDSDDYLEALLEDKQTACTKKYPQISEQLSRAGKKKAAEAFDQFGAVAKTHLGLLNEILSGSADDATTYYVCQICGHVVTNTPPQNCPVCNAIQEKFSME